MGKDQTTTPGTLCRTFYDECVGSLTSLADHNSEDAGDGAYGLSSLSEKTRISTISIFSSVILRPWVLVRSGARTRDLAHGSLMLYQLS